mmetsp:Transcript_10970/g.16563  ORF Transcript_10970/g.16563 Transcript_10970/m.16563 type:complete len:382 (-) Transcript_10970:124-1269(-)|eukprot:CAMPEP_0116022654 /NCGR_PEP_ID=MMETSP0321-20121206/11112_1 /TAXON_ID=163516 /ORGANISM="Leptocylindrus danicus var. danicus, Strain B650" /LENGTH=381 /DNA_ID=CAMNT_0003493759 /DNA_START=103 /DNA_END=1248 /DNA_ORIENTATION=-
MGEEVEDHIQRHFELGQKMGKGAYGIVWKAIERTTRKVVALKKCFEAFRNSTDAQRTFREVMYLQALGHHDNIIRLQHAIKADNGKDLYLSFDFMETDLYVVIRAGILQPIHRKYIAYQILKALKYIHSADLLHRDIKPSNLLLNSDCHVKLCDFGLCRSVVEAEASGRILTDYVATRWYRSPEILTGSTKYTKGVDMWSFGCILGEMICSRPILPGNSTMNQIELILQVTGRPQPNDIESMLSPYASTMLLEGMSDEIEYTSLTEICNKEACPDSLDLMGHCLQFNPTKRSSAEAALRHPYVAEFHNENEEPSYPHGSIRINLNDNTKLSALDYRTTLYNEIHTRNKNIAKQAASSSCQRGVNRVMYQESVCSENATTIK